MSVEIRVDGLAELRKALTRIGDLESRGDLRDGLKDAADVVAKEARDRMPSGTGRAKGSVRATAGGNKAYIRGGRASVPYYGWLDFGSRTPKTGNPRDVGPWKGSGKGPRKGRYIYPALDARERQVVELIEHAVSEALRKAGL